MKWLRWLPFVVNIGMIANAVFLRLMIAFDTRPLVAWWEHWRYFTAGINGIIVLILCASGICSIFIRTHKRAALATVISSIVGLGLCYFWFELFRPG